MSKTLIITLALCGMLCIGAFTLFAVGTSYFNQEVALRATIMNKIAANKSDLANAKRQVIQSGAVTEAGADLIIKAIQANAGGRAGGDVFKMVKEAVPNVDLKLHVNLMNIITSASANFNDRQKELLGLKTAHDNIIHQFPGNIVFMILGKTAIDVPIVTSSAVEQAYVTGKDDDMSVFSKK